MKQIGLQRRGKTFIDLHFEPGPFRVGGGDASLGEGKRLVIQCQIAERRMVSSEDPDAAEGGVGEEQPGLSCFTLQRQVFGREQPQMGFFQRVEVPGGDSAGDSVRPRTMFR